MAKRKHRTLRRVDTTEVQGEGSFVVVQRMTWGVMKNLLPEADKLTQREVAVKLIPQLVIDWNWVDDDGKELPKPKDNPEVFDQVNDEELEFLLRCLDFEQADTKN